ncbi:yaeM [Wigglesworthia glossinidia endosymbiont of Glossina brevipalpis]|uniref:1-deoxy-D-xylulose 5-phosphate reductoisomerase n=1 Tax=Wigglesworthia glossinidia brevipalpis TaxID=36870 RepID=DXR_WIGBR|nr:RecName: Full=1-deoxy-D-xylulose 5-phosphate reductoisomerase; Short=DXP reductoisomerase; AltName: Full=1-deoxyxylulose-5-phosphate reductoisomerase; AltName: Full=2-C-methyl-D-erythritol 4-phosphate synthase [Wigglesworthia glossinidia endosymbiont of Glossina brevipalpis]BAC24534.1 yaeM [Wigglesworthia glossinidia endosymbiont of Glossina brevipalpis]
MKKITILGSTGSIGKNTLKIISNNLDKFSVYSLVAYGNNINVLISQCIKYKPNYVCIMNKKKLLDLKQGLLKNKCKTSVLFGSNDICNLSSSKEVDIVISATVGLSGIFFLFSAIKSGKKILLANKEILVSCGHFFMKQVEKYKSIIIPIDSEHNAIFQSLPLDFQKKLGIASINKYGIYKLILTGSGGPFRNVELRDLKKVSPDQACNHPNWKMGKKISIDSATMMNKGFEYIVAKWLFNVCKDQIELIIHHQSIIHSMIRYIDGTVIANMSLPDMQSSISYGLGYPKRIKIKNKYLDFYKNNKLTFESIDYNRYPCLNLAIQASYNGQGATTVLNSANEISVSAFLSKKIYFTDIAIINKKVLDKLDIFEPSSIEEILLLDSKARNLAKKFIKCY